MAKNQAEIENSDPKPQSGVEEKEEDMFVLIDRANPWKDGKLVSSHRKPPAKGINSADNNAKEKDGWETATLVGDSETIGLGGAHTCVTWRAIPIGAGITTQGSMQAPSSEPEKGEEKGEDLSDNGSTVFLFEGFRRERSLRRIVFESHLTPGMHITSKATIATMAGSADAMTECYVA
ncbi:hypothetical protein F4782DRAFT_530089 [Xylaria castorea]|nr:hypothetical protein F4782DRAFT_530089 [Xylaria castorea]